MKKIVSILAITFLFIVFCLTNYSLATEGYSFDLQYTGTITKNEEKDAKVLLVGKGGILYTKVRIKVDVKGPATPKLLATDTNGTEHNIAELGYWGPAEGFPVQGDFTNTTPVKATFPEAGKYTITLTLLNLENGSTITTNTFDIDVVANGEIVENNTIVNNEVNNVEELPKTGVSVLEYVLIFVGLGVIFCIFGRYISCKNS